MHDEIYHAKGERKMKLRNKKIKQENGITLIALVITIVVLLILAGVSINAVFNENGLIKKAQDAQNKMNEAQQSDLAQLDELDSWLENVTKKEEKSLDMSKYVGHSVTIEGTKLLVLSADEADATIATATTIDSIGRSKIDSKGEYGYTTDKSAFLYKNSTYESFINEWVEKSALKNYMIKTNIDIKNYDTFGNTSNIETYAYPQTEESIKALFISNNCGGYGHPYAMNDETNGLMYVLNSEVDMCSGDEVYESMIAMFFTQTQTKEKGFDFVSTHTSSGIKTSPTHPVFKITNITASKITDNGIYEKTSPYSPQVN